MRMKRVLALCLAALLCASGAQAELKKGDRGGRVLKVQDELHARGYLEEEGDGQYGKNTEDAVKSFQKEHKIEPTGVVDDITYDKLLGGEEAKQRKAQQQLKGLGYLEHDADQTTAEAIAAFQQANGLEATGELDDETLALMDSGDAKSDIVRVQERLKALGYLQGAADGDFGAKSVAALKWFQREHNLEVTGESSDATWDALFSESAKEVYPTLNSVSENAGAVKKLQQKLIDLGFLSGKADGDYGAKTYDAVLEFQRRLAQQGYAIEPDGEADSEMQSILFGEDYSTYIADVQPGDEDSEVQRVERRLRALGYMDASADESYDAYAVECMKAFQTDAGLTVTGKVDQTTIDALFDADAAQSEQFVLHDVRMGEDSAVAEYAQNALIRMGFFDHYVGMASGEYDDLTETALGTLYAYLVQHNPLRAETFAAKESMSAHAVRSLMEDGLIVYSGDITADSDAEEISRLQRRLRGLYYTVNIDGKYGEDTAAAVEAFQAMNGLSVTGAADEMTQRKLFSDTAVGNWTEYMLKVSIDDQRVYVYQLDEEKQYQQIDAFICSTGLEDSTPRGIFSDTTEPLDRWHYFIEYECWAQYAWRIKGTIYFHSVIFSEKDESTLRMSSVYNLGHKASHGCIRLKVEDAKWIYENCDAGTIVTIY